jgi:hypothetical protein
MIHKWKEIIRETVSTKLNKEKYEIRNLIRVKNYLLRANIIIRYQYVHKPSKYNIVHNDHFY